MRPKYFDSQAHRSFWSVHIEAWRRSGLPQRAYCDQHRLPRLRFSRWLKHLVSEEEIRKHQEYLRELQREKRSKKPLRPRYGVRTDMRCRAVQAFWAMHVEALNWSGMRLHDYASSLNLSPTSLRKWRNRLEEGELAVDWRALLHPSARPKISSGISSAAKDRAPDSPLTVSCDDDRPGDGRANRRSFTDEEKRSIVLESEQPDVTVAEVCRRHGIVTSMVFRWRVQFGFASRKTAKLATVTREESATGGPSTPVILHDLLRPPTGMMSVDLSDGRRVFAPEGSDPTTVRQQVLDMETQR